MAVINKKHEDVILIRYLNGESPQDISNDLGYKRTTIKEFVRRKGCIRSMSEASSLAIKKGKKEAFLAVGPEVRKRNRFNPKKAPWKGCPTKHPRWINDRTKLKQRRFNTEEKYFIKELLKEQNFICQLTGVNGTLSGHHIKPVWKYPESQFDKNNIIVILKKIHLDFHKKYGLKSDETDWESYVKKGEYNAIS